MQLERWERWALGEVWIVLPADHAIGELMRL